MIFSVLTANEKPRWKMAKLSVPILIDWKDIKDHLVEYDIVGVVRCRDCRYYMPKTHGCTMGSLMCPDENDYCSRGLQKGEKHG